MPAALTDQYGVSDKAVAFVRAYARLGSVSEAAKSSGVSESYGYILIRDPACQAALNAELRRELSLASPPALRTLVEVISDKSISANTRVKAAGMILDRAGFVAPRAMPAGSGVEKTLNDMSIDELKDLAAKLENEIVGRAKQVNAPPDYPIEPQPIDILE